MMTDKVYLLSMTFDGPEAEGGCYWLGQDIDVLVPSRSMGEAMAFDTELEASEYRSNQGFGNAYQITPIDAKRFFKAKLKGRP